MDKVTIDFARLVENHSLSEDLCLLIDESSFPKKEAHSVGIARGQRGVHWIGFDAFYGRDTALLASLVQDELEYLELSLHLIHFTPC